MSLRGVERLGLRCLEYAIPKFGKIKASIAGFRI